LAKSLFVNHSERAFFEALKRELSRSNHLLLTKVRMEDIVGVAPHVKDGRERWRLRGRVKSRHVDFLICSFSGTPLMAIELDGSAHEMKGSRGRNVQNADDLKDRIFNACGLMFTRVSTDEDFAIAAQAIFRKI
jgi:very-short-patch-repair endonuclease